MSNERERAAQQPGFHWLGFTARIPILHTRVCWPEFFQGILVSAATALALVPLLTTYFGLSFEEAIAMSFLHSFLISASWMIFGEPYASGWLTPALPFVLTLLLSDSFSDPTERLQMMTAISLDFALLLAVLGVSGLGAKLIKVMPEVLKGAVILGASIAAFLKVFDLQAADNIFNTHPYSASVAIGLSLLLAFSAPLHRLAARYPMLARLVALGLLPGFVLGAVIGAVMGELQFDIQMGFFALPMMDMFNKVSPFAIGWPSLEMFIQGMPLALIGYILFFGDLLTGKEVLAMVAKNREDEPLNFNDSRTHISVAIRNAISALIAPFFPTQGILWTGIHVVIAQRWQQGRQAMGSLFDGISSYYMLGLPFIFFLAPVVTGIKPMMPIALAVTLALTGFACAYVAMAKAKNNAERGCMLLSAMCLAMMDPWLGLILAVLMSVFLVDFKAEAAEAD
ncbi:hypothetical protein [Pseudoteredinibacter isoporae]|uniref:hypothetical protein n=1 Tax=Pseudoteredinibacter isoporae TaxID=570281 RepID=UPI00310B5169